MTLDIDSASDDLWQDYATEALLCTSTGWYRRKFHQYRRELGYRTRNAALVYVVDGQGGWACEQGQGSLTAGDLLCLPPGVWAWHDPDPQTGWEECWCTFAGSAWNLISGELFSDFPQVHHIGRDPSLVVDFARMRNAMQLRQPGWRLEVAADLHHILARCRSLRQRPSASTGLAAAGQDLLRILADASDQADIDVQAVARAHGVHYDSLRRHFRALTGRSPKRYHTDLRLQAAAQLLLANPTMPVASIAAAYGWHDPAWFSRHFTQWKGCSPSVWRQHGSGSVGVHG